MGKIIMSENVSLDGVIEDPAGDEGFRVGGWVGRLKAGWTFPVETMIINVSGCVVIGLLAGSVVSVRAALAAGPTAFVCKFGGGTISIDKESRHSSFALLKLAVPE